MTEGAWLARLRANAEIVAASYEDSCCILHVRAPPAIVGQLRRFVVDPPSPRRRSAR
jgi:hypothetical protein